LPLETLKIESSLAAGCGEPGTRAGRKGARSGGRLDRVVEVLRKGARARIFFTVLSAILCGYFVWSALTSQQGLLSYLELKKTLVRLREENLAQRRKNAQLEKEIYLLRYSPDYVEKVAREEFGYLREGEALFWFSDQTAELEGASPPVEGLPAESSSHP